MAVSVSPPSQPAFELDERQHEAVEHVHGPILVVAGAGTGKTTVLTRRIAHLVRSGSARPSEILAVTYTRNSAQEMRERVQAELRGSDLSGLQICTFHEYCNHLLLRSGKGFGLLDDKDLWIYLRRRIRELRLNYFVRAANVARFLTDLLDFMRRCHDELVTPEKYAAYVEKLERGELPIPRVGKAKDALTQDEVLGRCREIASVFATVERMLQEENLGTFSHMITRAHEVLAHETEQLGKERERTRFILVDEFQDANFAQVKILDLLAGEERNVFAVGDPDQAIYQFRGASSAAFELFRRRFPGSKFVVLGKNRRSTTPILQTAFAVISKNPEVFSTEHGALPVRRSPLVSAREQDALQEGQALASPPVDAALYLGKGAECSDLAAAIRERRRETRCKWRQIAVLYRLHTHRDGLAAELAEQEIPFSIENMDVMDTPEARDLFACLGAVVSESDGASLFRVAALPQFCVDAQNLRAGMRSLSKNAEGGLASVLREIAGGPQVLEHLRLTREEIASSGATSLAAARIVIRTFRLHGSRPLAAVLDFIAGWEEKAFTKTKGLAELLEYLEYFREAGGAIALASRDDDAVSLMTAHTAKGLEWDHVFILRANSGSFPHSYKQLLVEFPPELRDEDSVGRQEGKALHDEEERRLFYVAMTRARDTLTIYARQGKGKKDPTPAGYVRELLEDAGSRPWLRKRETRAVAGELFAEAAPRPASTSRTSQWLELPPASNPDLRLSATAVEIYETCPLQFKLEREWRIPREIPAAMQYGAAVHRVLRTYYDSVRLQRILSDETLIELLKADLEQAGIHDRYQHELYQTQGVAQLRDFLVRARQSPVSDVLHTEEGFEIDVCGTTVVGRIDRMDRTPDGGVVITDYKTGKPKSQEDADQSLQLSIYAIAAREKWGHEVTSLAFYNLEENTPVFTSRSSLQLQEAQLKVKSVAEEIAAGNFTAKPGFHCGFCPYHNLCPATEKRFYGDPSKTPAGKTSRKPD